MKPGRQFLHFLWIGGIGFFVDGGILTLLSVTWGMNVYLARVFSFFLATIATWWLSRTYAFSHAAASAPGGRSREYLRHILVQIGGGLINFGAFSWCIILEPDWRAIPFLPLAVGSACGLIWNFTGAKLWTFRSKSRHEPQN